MTKYKQNFVEMQDDFRNFLKIFRNAFSSQQFSHLAFPLKYLLNGTI